ncbi:hypothetical protein FISHEDRAFT_61353 [Fistulina hepatica ATCC 64428]|uniref:MYND-type domain-containing protein n=1 Tax=Fistulina hepatica ATCC 64428 TaxID=1128425 RepID=A0A0D7A2Z0_9AGAR|nr:hypothetical protein FISHEDRAFT_61353 [Fistulina hepatica ATCC 64428]
MLQCSAPGCTLEAKNRCSRCKTRPYCGSECQAKDWQAHRKECNKFQSPTSNGGNTRPAFNPAGFSPFGIMCNPSTGQTSPISTTAFFFAELFGYVAERPELVYTEVVDTYRIYATGDYMQAAQKVDPSPEDLVAGFPSFVDRAHRSGIFPDWWKDEHREGILKFAQEDEWGRLDRGVVPKEQIQAHLPKPARIVTLEMIIERIENTA